MLGPAEQEFATKGFADASLNRILSQAGMSKGQAYYYIADKADLYGAVLESAYQRLVCKLSFNFGHPENAEQYWQQVAELFGRVGLVLFQDQILAALAIRVYDSDITRTIAQQLPFRTAFDALIEQGQQLGAVRSDLPNDLLRDMLFAMALEVDRWFGANWAELRSDIYLDLNTRIIGLFRSVAQPPSSSSMDLSDI